MTGVQTCALPISSGIIHRDLKPANLFICQARGRDPEYAKVLDFGVSRFTAADGHLDISQQTRNGVIIGTPFYMAPEQMDDDPAESGLGRLGPAADIWAFGTLLVVLLPAGSVALTLMVLLPSGSGWVGVAVQVPSGLTVVVMLSPVGVVMVIVSPALPVPLMVGVLSLVIPSPTVPLSLLESSPAVSGGGVISSELSGISALEKDILDSLLRPSG